MFDFLTEMKKYCEIIIFTAATKEYADVILDCLEINNINNLNKYEKKHFNYNIDENSIMNESSINDSDCSLEELYKNRLFDFRLYRQHTSFHGISIVKDLSWIGRDMNKTIIIDNIADNFKLQHSNGLHIKTWCGDIKDQELLYLHGLLGKIFIKNPSNVIPYLKQLKDGYKKSNTYSDVELFI